MKYGAGPQEELVAETGEPCKGGLFDFGFGEGIGVHSFNPLNMKIYSLPDFCFIRYPCSSRWKRSLLAVPYATRYVSTLS